MGTSSPESSHFMRRNLSLILFLAWSLLLTGGYYLFHRLDLSGLAALPSPAFPGWTAWITHWMLVFRDLTAAIGLVLAGLGLGRVLLGRFLLDGLDGLALQCALGSGILSLGWLGLAAAGWVHSLPAWVLLASLLTVLNRQIRDGLQQLEVLKDYWTFSGRLEKIFLFFAALAALNQVWTALSPPIKYDALTYHLTIPQQIAAAGRITYPPENPYWGHPWIAEMIFTWAIALGRTQTAALVAWLLSLVTFLGIAGMAARWLPEPDDARQTSAVVGMTLAALLSAATIRWMGAWAYTDLFSALMGLGAISCFFAWRESGRHGWLYWMGVFIGLTVGTKYTAGLLALFLFPAALLNPGVKSRPLRSVLLSGLIALMVFSPWALKNLAFTGSPIFPYAIPVAGYDSARLAAANLPAQHNDWAFLAALPVSYTWMGIDSGPGSGTDLGPLLIWFAMPALYLFRRSTRARLFAIALGVCWLVIALAGSRLEHLRQPRLFFAFLPVLAACAGWGWSAVQAIRVSGLRLRNITGSLVLLSLAGILLQEIPRPLVSGALVTAVGLQTEEQFLYENTGAYYEAMQAIAGLPSNSRVLMLWEGRGLYAPASAVPDPWLDRWRTDLRQQGSAQKILENWKTNGYTHILVYEEGRRMMGLPDRNLSHRDWAEYDRLFAALPPPTVLTGSFYRLYQLP